MPIGYLQQTLSTAAEARQLSKQLLDKGALSADVILSEGSEEVDLLISLDRSQAAQIIGKPVPDSAWLEEVLPRAA